MANAQPLEPRPTGALPAGEVSLCTLGGFGLYRADGTLLLGAGKPLAFLTYLHALPGRSASRDHLLHTLWADVDEGAARHALRQTTWYLRRHLGDDALVVTPGTLTLAAPIHSDHNAFLAAIEAGRLAEAVTIYRGDFLPSFAVPGGLGFEHWADSERSRYRLLFRRAAEALTRVHLAEGRFQPARELANRLRDAEPLDETSWRLLLESALASGNQVSALADTETLEQLLADEGREPEPATKTLLLRVRSQAADVEQPEALKLLADLVGRERQFATLIAAFRRVRRGAGEALQIVAAAGLGKTRLLRDFERHLGSQGNAALAYARALPADRELPWSYAGEVVRQLTALPGAVSVSPVAASSLASLDPSISARWPGVAADRAAGDEAFRRRGTALAELVRAAGDERPLALLLDDLHWADPISRALLDRVAARLQDTPVLAVFAYRPDAAVTLSAAEETVQLDPFDAEQTGAVVASLGVLPAEDWAAQLATNLQTAAHGSPLLLMESLKLALDTGCLTLADGCWHCPDPPTLRGLLQAGSALSRRIAQLDPSERHLLFLLALAESPVSAAILAAVAPRNGADTGAVLAGLERRGLVGRAGSAWMVAHDEIAARAREGFSSEQRAAAEASLGSAVLQRAVTPADVRLAARHFAAGGVKTELVRAAAHWIYLARAAGDRRPAGVLVAELVGSQGSDLDSRRLVSSLPWRVRFRRVPVALTAAVVGLTLAAGLLVFPRVAAETSVITLGVWKREQGNQWRLHTRDLTRRDLRSEVVSIDSLVPTAIISPDRPRGALRPGAFSTLAATRTFPDSGGEDVVLVYGDGRAPVRLTLRPGDDVVGDWSPDGRFLVIQTDRWSNTSMSDLAIIDPRSPDSVVARLTSQPGTRDVWPLWSPDGSRVAFVRAFHDNPAGTTNAICLVSVDGRQESCLNVAGYMGVHLLAWASAAEIVGSFRDSRGSSRVLLVNTETDEVRQLGDGAPSMQQSHAAGWVACFCRRNGGEPYQSLLFAAANPDQAIRLEPGDPPPPREAFAAERSSWLDRLRIQGGEHPLPADGAYRLRVSGWDANGRPVRPLAVRWTSADTAVAVIDGDGLVRTRRAGQVMIRATAGGWRSDSALVTIAASTVRTEVVETWGADFERRWALFGEPRPFVVPSARGRALAPNGDSTFTSGAYLIHPVPTQEGLGVELVLSAPITNRNWQVVRVNVTSNAGRDLSAWDHRTGNLLIPDQEWRSCTIHYPNGGRLDQMQFRGGIGRPVPVDSSVGRGAWIRVRLQIFPDRRCGLAVNGQAVAILDRPIPLGDSAFVVIDAYSHRTRILVGSVTIWRGVRRDIDWD